MVMVERVSLWDRTETSPEDEVENVLRIFRDRHPDQSSALIEAAFTSAYDHHDGQMRKSGEAYITHPVAVAEIIAELGLDDISIASALLHDTVEDTGAGLDEIEDQFGSEVATIVDGVTKLDRLQFDSKEAQQAASLRKMMVAVAKDVRVLIIKFADRLHNLRTLGSLPPWKQQRIATETLDIYAPLAHRLGMQELKNQMEDISFAALHPKRYSEIDHMVATRAPERELYLTQVLSDVQARLAELGIDADVTGREKHLWSIYEKMVLKGRSFDEIFDLVGIRVIVANVRDCYGALGSIHATWSPVQGRFKDYIAMPKFNLYQSLHTTVIGPQGKPLEVQIRTREMHQRAEFGIASHFEYKDRVPTTGDLAWLSRIIDWQSETEDHSEFMSNLKLDLDQDEVFVFTPAGEVVTLAAESTPVDFAYTIHTEVGHACRGARVNKRLVPLDTVLASGDTVEILTSKVEEAGPSQDWLKFVATHRERQVGRGKRRARGEAGVIVEGIDDVMIRLAKCCTPVPPDEIMGFVTRGRGVSVHRDDCANAVSLAAGHANRLIDVEWDDDSSGTFIAAIEVKAFDRTRLLQDVASVLGESSINILAASTRTGSDRISVMQFEFELGDGGHLDWLLSTIKRIDGVYDAYRVVPGKGS